MPDKEVAVQGQDPEPAPADPERNSDSADPGPIELDVVMKNIGQASGPMAGMDL